MRLTNMQALPDVSTATKPPYLTNDNYAVKVQVIPPAADGVEPKIIPLDALSLAVTRWSFRETITDTAQDTEVLTVEDSAARIDFDRIDAACGFLSVTHLVSQPILQELQTAADQDAEIVVTITAYLPTGEIAFVDEFSGHRLLAVNNRHGDLNNSARMTRSFTLQVMNYELGRLPDQAPSEKGSCGGCAVCSCK